MARNTRFTSHEPLAENPSLELQDNKTTGPFGFLNPTTARFQHANSSPEAASNSDVSKPSRPSEQAVEYKWTSRNNRKGRHALVVSPEKAAAIGLDSPTPTSQSVVVTRGIIRMFTTYPIWDVSYLVAIIFTWGSVVWVINAFFVFLPLIKPSSAFPNESLSGGGISAFIGATIFEIGSILLMIEAVNENRAGCFGWAVEKVVSGHVTPEHGFKFRLSPDTSACTHHHVNKRNLVGKGAVKVDGIESSQSLKPDDAERLKNWTWFPSWVELHEHYIRELGFLACSFQMFGATIFWISGFTALPGILNKLSPGLEDGIYWTPQIIGGSGFIISGLLFMIETQESWWKPAPGVLGWHIGGWNFIGGLGFTLSPAFGYDTSSWAQYQAACSTYWASWAFLIGSLIQLYESLEKYPVEIERSERNDTK